MPGCATFAMATLYEITVEGHVDGRWFRHFEEINVKHSPAGETVIRATVPDQAALHGLLALLRDLSLSLISLKRLDT
jgi:hypothetical protein